MVRVGERTIGGDAEAQRARVCVGAVLVPVAPVRLLLVAGLRVKQRSLLVLLDHSTDCLRVWIDGVRWRPTVV